MSKAVLLMDMPESCMGCNFMYCDIDNNKESCQAKENARPIDLEKESKPDWCPLRPMPKKKLSCDVHNVQSMAEGIAAASWNACFDAIMEEGKKHE